MGTELLIVRIHAYLQCYFNTKPEYWSQHLAYVLLPVMLPTRDHEPSVDICPLTKFDDGFQLLVGLLASGRQRSQLARDYLRIREMKQTDVA